MRARTTDAESVLALTPNQGDLLSFGCGAGRAGVSVALQPIDPGEIEKAVSRLAPCLGPIAKVVANEAAAQTKEPRTLYLRFADNLANPEDRTRFLNDAGYS